MKKILSCILILGMLAGTLLAFASCGDAKEPVGGGAQISVYLGNEVFDLDPQGNQTDDASLAVVSLLFEPLFKIGTDGKVSCAAAESYKINKSAHTLTVSLRESYWSDGSTLVRASDYVYSWKRLLRSDSNNPAAALLFDVKGAADVKNGLAKLDSLGLNAVDNLTLEITFEDGFTAYESFLRNLANVALSPLNQKVMSGKDNYWAKQLTSLSTNGAFRVTEYNLEKGSFRLDRNKGYHRAAGSKAVADAYVTPATLKTIWNVDVNLENDEYVADLIDRLAEKTVFYVGEIPQSLREDKKSSAVVTDTLSTYSYLFNCSKEQLADKAVRKILANSIDRDEVLSIMVYGKAATGLIAPTVNDGMKASSSWKTGEGALPATLSVSEAKSQLAAISGFTPGEISITFRDTTIDTAIAEYVKGIWEELGFTVTLVPVLSDVLTVADGEFSEDALQLAYESGNFDVIALDYQMFSTNAFPALATFSDLYCGGGIDYGTGEGILSEEKLEEIIGSAKDAAEKLDAVLGNTETPVYVKNGNRAAYVSEEFNAKIAAAYAEGDLSKRNAILHEAEAILLADAPIAPLVFNQNAYLASGELSGISVSRFGYASFTKTKQKNYEQYLTVETEAPATEEGAEETEEIPEE